MAAIVTGGGSGIGFEIAKILYLEEGQDLILVGRNADRLRDAKLHLEKEQKTNDPKRERTLPGSSYGAEIRSSEDVLTDKRSASTQEYPTIRTRSLDVSDLSACRVFHKYFEHLGLALDYLINAAGFGTIGSFTDTDLDREAAETDTNCRGLLQMTKLFLPDLMKSKGRLLNVASSAGYMPGSPGMAVYYASKAYVLSLTRSIRAEKAVRESGAHISALCPGPVATEFSEKAGGGADSSGLEVISAETCARAAVRGLKKGKDLIIPGGLMKWTYPLAKILPASWLLFFAGRHQDHKLKAFQRITDK